MAKHRFRPATQSNLSTRTFCGQHLRAVCRNNEWTADAFVGNEWCRFQSNSLSQLWLTVRDELKLHGPWPGDPTHVE